MCASIHEPSVMSVNASTYAYAENDSAATNSHASTGAPVTGSAKPIGSPAQSTSIDSPGSRWMCIDAPVDATQPAVLFIEERVPIRHPARGAAGRHVLVPQQ